MNTKTEKKRILIIHGWMHSSMRYRRLQKDLESTGRFQIDLYEFPGFGASPPKYSRNILKRYATDLRQYLKENTFDIILSHSMGGNVLLKALLADSEDVPRCRKLILLSPVYGGVDCLKPLIFLYPVIPAGLRFLQLPLAGCRLLVKLVSLLTINSWSDIDLRIIADARRADPKVAARTMMEMAFDRWKVKKTLDQDQVLLVLGAKDRVISKRKMEKLRRDLGGCRVKVLKGIGHTAVVEDYQALVRRIFAAL